MAAGTIVRPHATALAPYAFSTATCCTFDTSEGVQSTSLLPSTSALAPSYSSSTQRPDEHRLGGHGSMYHNRPQSVPMTSCRGTKGHSYTYGVSPQQVGT